MELKIAPSGQLEAVLEPGVEANQILTDAAYDSAVDIIYAMDGTDVLDALLENGYKIYDPTGVRVLKHPYKKPKPEEPEPTPNLPDDTRSFF